MTSLTIESTNLIETANKLNKYVCAYPSRSNNVSDALTSVGCRKMNKVFELVESAKTENDVKKLKTAIRNLMKTINQYSSRTFAVNQALKTQGCKLLNQLDEMSQ